MQISEAVFARTLSSQKESRVFASTILKGPQVQVFSGDKKQFLNGPSPSLYSCLSPLSSLLFLIPPPLLDIRDSIYASKIVSYAQGYVLMAQAAKEFKWELNYGGIALMWRGGCIIRSKFLGKVPLW